LFLPVLENRIEKSTGSPELQRSGSMKKAQWLKRTNPLLFLVLVIQAATGLGHEWIPEEWFEWLHPVGGLLLLLLAAVHLALNWSWVESVYFASPPR
jgi:hypothetical protein